MGPSKDGNGTTKTEVAVDALTARGPDADNTPFTLSHVDTDQGIPSDRLLSAGISLNSALGTVKLVYPPIHRHYDLGLFHLKRAHNEEDAIIDEVMQEEKLRRKRRGEHLGSRWTFKEE